MERYHVIGGHLRLDPEGTVTSYADAQRALDAEQEQILSLGIKLDTSNGIRNGMSETIATLQAQLRQVEGDRQTLRQLVEALPVAGLPVEHARSDDFVVLQANGEWMVHTYNYWAKFATEEEARAYIALLEYRASLPAQPAQGGASKPVTTCNRHSDCDAADEKARAKGALHADHCHDDCCSECFGN